MKIYKKEYESLFTNEDNLGKCDLSRICIRGMSLKEYLLRAQNFLQDVSESEWWDVVKYYWLQKRFSYENHWKVKKKWNGTRVDNAYQLFFLHYVGISHKLIISSSYYHRVISYVDELLPGFEEYNPFVFEDLKHFKFPFKHITIDFLSLVWKMDERIDLLKIADKEKMSYASFTDYVLNYIFCYNAEHDENIYEYVGGGSSLPFFQKKKKKIII